MFRFILFFNNLKLFFTDWMKFENENEKIVIFNRQIFKVHWQRVWRTLKLFLHQFLTEFVIHMSRIFRIIRMILNSKWEFTGKVSGVWINLSSQNICPNQFWSRNLNKLDCQWLTPQNLLCFSREIQHEARAAFLEKLRIYVIHFSECRENLSLRQIKNAKWKQDNGSWVILFNVRHSLPSPPRRALSHFICVLTFLMPSRTVSRYHIIVPFKCFYLCFVHKSSYASTPTKGAIKNLSRFE